MPLATLSPEPEAASPSTFADAAASSQPPLEHASSAEAVAVAGGALPPPHLALPLDESPPSSARQDSPLPPVARALSEGRSADGSGNAFDSDSDDDELGVDIDSPSEDDEYLSEMKTI